MIALVITLGGLAFLILVFLGLCRLWQRTPEGKLEWKIAVILRINRGIERRQKDVAEEMGPYREMSDFNMRRFTPSYEELAKSENRLIPGPVGDIPLRIYRPLSASAGPLPLVLFYHGGGFVAGSIDTHDPLCRQISAGAGVIVVSVEYRLAPEYPYPAAPEDCYSALLWAYENAGSFGGDPDNISVAGDSAGGNLTTVTAMISRDRGGPALRSQVLIYPNTNGCFLGMPSHTLYSRGYFLESKQMEWLADRYVPNLEDRFHPYASPYQSEDLRKMPPALVITAQCDPMRDEGKAYADKLAEAGIPVRYHCFPGVTHGFLCMPTVTKSAGEALCMIIDELKVRTERVETDEPVEVLP